MMMNFRGMKGKNYRIGRLQTNLSGLGVSLACLSIVYLAYLAGGLDIRKP